MAEHAADFGQARFQAGEAGELVEGEVDDALGDFHLAGDGDLRGRTAAQIEHHLGRELEAGNHEGRVDAALEAVARIRLDAELAAGLGDVGLIPQRRFDQHVGRRLRAA